MAKNKMSQTTQSAINEAKTEAKLARADALKARAEATRARAVAIGGGPVNNFIDFIREKGVIGLAVGLAIGTAATGVVTQIVGALITPTVSLLIGQDGLKGLNLVVKRAADGAPLVTYALGDLIDALIKFLAVALVIYFVVHGLKLDKIDKKKDD